MKAQLKGYLVGFISAVVLFSSINVYADGLNKTLDVVVNKISIAINGTVVGKAGTNYTLDNGENVPYSILYKGTTYLPMRKVAELVGKSVQWDSTTNTAGINDNTNTTPVTSDNLVRLQNNIYFRINQEGLYSINNNFEKLAKEGEEYYINWRDAQSLLNILEEGYEIGSSENPYLKGIINMDAIGIYSRDLEFKYSDINTRYIEGSIYKASDKNKVINVNTNEESKDGMYVVVNGNPFINLHEMLDFFEYNDRFTMEFEENKIIFNITI